MIRERSRVVGETFAVVALMLVGPTLAADAPASGPTIQIPPADRAVIEEHLGKGVVGKAVAAEVIESPMEWVQLQREGVYPAHITHGDEKGKIVGHEIKKEKGPGGREQWRMSAGAADILVFGLNQRGELVFLSHAEPAKKLNGIYNPPPPLLLKGMKPGTTTEMDFDVKIVKMDDPSDVEHEGKLKLKLSYLGMHEIRTPAGKFNAALIKSEYIGKIGPAKIDDSQYRFVAKDVGVVAMVEFKDISAFLVYNETLKVGKMLGKK